jgi:hypothetical protein
MRTPLRHGRAALLYFAHEDKTQMKKRVARIGRMFKSEGEFLQYRRG